MDELDPYPYTFTQDEEIRIKAGNYYEYELWGRFIVFYKETKHGTAYENRTSEALEAKIRSVPDTRGFAMADYGPAKAAAITGGGSEDPSMCQSLPEEILLSRVLRHRDSLEQTCRTT